MTSSTAPLFDQPSLPEAPSPKAFPVAESVALYGPESLSDAQIIEAMLNRARPGRAEEILLLAENLGRLVAMGPSELQALGLTKTEMARFAVLQEVQRRSTRSFNHPRITSPDQPVPTCCPRSRAGLKSVSGCWPSTPRAISSPTGSWPTEPPLPVSSAHANSSARLSATVPPRP